MTGSLAAQILLLIGGLIFCFSGERIFRLFLVLAGFLAGAWLCWNAAAGTEAWLRIVLAAAGGLLGVLAAMLLYKVSFLVAGCAAGWAASRGLLGLGIPASLLVAALTGLAGLLGARYLMAFSTAVTGAAASASALGALAGAAGIVGLPPIAVPAAAACIATAGAAVQFSRIRRR